MAHTSRIDRLEHLTRAGWLSKGFVFVVIGLLAVQLALHDWATGPGRRADQTGALRAVAEQPLGGVLLAAIAVGLVVFAIWNVAQALVPESAGVDPLGLAMRIGWFGLGVFYGALAVAGFRLAATAIDPDDGSGPTSTGSDATALTARLLDAPGGRWLAGLTAIVVLAVAGYHLRKGLTFAFVDDLDTSTLDPDRRRWLARLGVGGFVARAIVLAVVAWFLLRAAVEFEPGDAVGLDGALREVAALTYGKILLTLVGVGLLVAGVYDMVTFRLQQIR